MIAFSLLAIALAIYFAPTIIAIQRHHPHALAIFAVNLLLGWTLLGWAGALMWAIAVDDEPRAAR